MPKHSIPPSSRAPDPGPDYLNMLPSFALLLLALMMLGYGIFDVMESTQGSRWKSVPCEVQKIEILDTPEHAKPFAMDVSFRYQWDGRWYRGTRYCLETEGSKFYQPLAVERDALLNAKEQGSTTCRVNPARPSEAVLKPGEVSTGGLIACIVGIGFSAIFGQLVWLTWHNKSTSEFTTRIVTPLVKVALGVLGGFMLVSGGAADCLKYGSAQQWQPTAGTVIWSRIQREEQVDRGRYVGGHYTIFHPDVFYQYTVDGREYRSNGESIYPSSEFDLTSAEGLQRQYPTGATLTCYVNPAQPWQAVRDRDWHYSGLLPLSGLPFAVIGIWGVIGTIRAMVYGRKTSNSSKRSSGKISQR